MQSDRFIILYELSKKIKFKGAKVFLTTQKLGDFLGISQQSASRYLKKLEKEGFIKRDLRGNGQWIEITGEGIIILKKVYQDLRTFLEFNHTHPKILRGKIVDGLGEGGYYIKAYSKKIEQKVGFKPYWGTLNVKLLNSDYSRKKVESNAPTKIKEFSNKNRVFGDIKLVPAEVFLRGKKEKVYIIIPQRTHHPEDELELIHPECLRKKFNLREGDEIEVRMEIGNFL